MNSFNGKLLAAINQKIQLYKWTLRDDGTRELQSECGHHGHILALYVQTRGDFIVVGDLMKSISLLIYKVSHYLIINVLLISKGGEGGGRGRVKKRKIEILDGQNRLAQDFLLL